MSSIDSVDARKARGVFLVVTETGTRYFVECNRKKLSGQVRCISDGQAVRTLIEGCVGIEPRVHEEPIIKVGEKMLIGTTNQLGVCTNYVVSITPLEGVNSLDIIMRPVCKVSLHRSHNCRVRMCNPFSVDDIRRAQEAERVLSQLNALQSAP